MTAMDMPAAEVDVDEALVRQLLHQQRPDLAALPIALVANGWDNVIYRVGDDLSVRLPRRQLAVALVEHEQRWLPVLAPTLSLPIAGPIWVGQPGSSYPWPWSVCRWLPGRTAAESSPTDQRRAAATLGEFLRSLHRPAPSDAPANPWRGIPLAHRTERTMSAVKQLGSLIDAPAISALWRTLSAVAPSTEAVWLHGDLHPANLIVADGNLSGIIDFGDLTSGDRATDLAVGWMMFSPADRAVFRDAAGAVDDDTWARSRGWALALGLVYLASSADSPTMQRIGQTTLAHALAS